MADDSKKVFLGDSAQPKAPDPLKKSLQPQAPLEGGAGGAGASSQPKVPLTTQQAKPPPGED
jgi:hypothetical protein